MKNRSLMRVIMSGIVAWIFVGWSLLAQAQEPPRAVPAGAAPHVGMSLAQLDVRLFGGYIAYEERVSIDPTISEWNAATWGFSGVLSGEGRDVIANVQVEYLGSLEDTEEWTSRGFLAQRNDLSFSSFGMLGELGFPIDGAVDTTVTPFLGVGYRFQQFSRSNFQTATPGFSDLGRVDEDYDLIYLNFAGLVDHIFSAESGVKLRADLGWFLYNEAENSFVGGAIEGDGGFLFRLAADWYWQLKPNQNFSLGVFFEHQALNGNTDSFSVNDPAVGRQRFVVEWPDNDLDRIGLQAGWNVRF